MNERETKAFDFAADLTKQLITLSTGIVTITLLFSKDLTGPRWLAVCAWVSYLLSTVFGLWALMALTGTLAPLTSSKEPEVADKLASATAKSADDPLELGNNVRSPAKFQIYTFALATVLTLIYVITTSAVQTSTAPAKHNCCCQCQPK
jgi:hypothetical protein